MLVSHVSEDIKSVVVGGKKEEEFKITDSIEFYTLLSSNIYSNKKLAVVREILNNAWDAHIASGKMNIPVDITINEEELIIRDYGNGINPDDMQDIYCTYGSSTKTADASQTGGFGLGSKSPWAYSEHFTVINNYNGIKTVYTAIKGNAISKEKPKLVTVVSVPTTESGLEVKVPVADISDMRTFISYATELAVNGGIRAKLNGILLDYLDYTKAKYSSVILKQNNNTSLTSRDILVKYGNVVYPIPSLREDDEYNRKIKIIHTFLGNAHSFPLTAILLAEPNTISVTPSRETLELTETTIKTLHNLMDEFIKDFTEKNYSFLYNQQLNKLIKLKNKKRSLEDLYNKATLEQYKSAQRYYRNNLTSNLKKKITLLTIPLSLALSNIYEHEFMNKYSSNYRNKIHKKLVVEQPKFYKGDWRIKSHKHLYKLLGAEITKKFKSYSLERYSKEKNIQPVIYDYSYSYAKYINIKQIYITYTQKALKSYLNSIKDPLYIYQVLHLSKKDDKNLIIKKLTDFGFKVIDITAMPQHNVVEKRAKPKSTRLKGYPLFSYCYQDNKFNYDRYLTTPQQYRVEEPEFLLNIRVKNNTKIVNIDSISPKLILSYFPNIAIAASSVTADKYNKVSFYWYVKNFFINKFKCDPEFSLAYYIYTNRLQDQVDFINKLVNIPSIQQEFNLKKLEYNIDPNIIYSIDTNFVNRYDFQKNGIDIEKQWEPYFKNDPIFRMASRFTEDNIINNTMLNLISIEDDKLTPSACVLKHKAEELTLHYLKGIYSNGFKY